MIDRRVSVQRCDDVESQVEVARSFGKLIRPLGAEGDLADVSSVVLKPNVCWAEDWKTGSTTCPQLVLAVVQWLRDLGIDDITLAEGSMVGNDTIQCLDKLGFMELARELDLRVVDLNRDDVVALEVPKPHVFEKMDIARTIAECEYFINMPVMKTHINTLVTVSMKNLKGVISHKWKRKLHFMGLDGGIADLASVATPDLIIVDGLVGQEGQGPLTGTPANAGVLLAGRDPLAVDFATSKAMGFDPLQVKHIAYFAEAAGIDLASFKPDVIGENLDELDIEFEKPSFSLQGVYEGVEILWGDPCSGCAGGLSVALERMQRSGELDIIRKIGGMTVALGKAVDPEPRERLILMGKCQYRNRESGIFIPGCPPPGMIVREMLAKLANVEPKYGSDLFVEEAEELYREEEE